ncbi:hypothetical protein CPB83DRAFT_859769 [Crepidotus variabilis]|uniref:Uncharacterized protein n=1 Tax=Crepidotus variabilis TaxID=179855 RepID=A0A9P6JLW1_9AGAR|nr:hypothetical protein CPB83DRAFT_859769 [Crepidotus variabilis]
MSNFKSLIFAFFAFLQLTTFVTARPQFKNQMKRDVDQPTLLTNAARMAAGLPPMKPRSMYTPTYVAARSNPSSVPVDHYVEIRRTSNQNSVGYISKIFPYGPTTINGLKMTVSIPSGSSPANLAITIGGAAYPYLGFSGDTLSASGTNAMTTTNAVPALSKAQSVGNSYAGSKSESAIWSYSPSTGKMTPSWIQATGSAVAVKLWYYPLNDSVGLIRSSNNPITGYQVDLYVV